MSSSQRAKVVQRCRCRLSSDIIMWEILPLLPVKTLCRFRCVSESWHHLLCSDPDFLQLHRRRSEQKPALLLVITPDFAANRTPFFNMKLNEHDGKRRVANSAADLGLDARPPHRKVSACRGLVLLYNRHTIRVWNPATGEHIDIEAPAVLRRNNDDCPLAAARRMLFGQDIVVAAAIGYVEPTGEYKVLIFLRRRRYKVSCEVLTIGGSGGSRGWRATKIPPPSFRFFFATHDTCNIAVVNGFVHVLSISSSSGLGIARFDLAKEDWSLIPGVDPCRLAPRYECYDLLLREVNGVLCFVQVSEDRFRAHIWLLKDYDKSIWVKEYTIDVSYGSYMWNRRGYIVEPLIIEEDGRIVFTSANLNLLFYYDPKSESFQEIYKDDEKKFPLLLSTSYSESLASLKRGKIGRIGRCPSI